MYNTIVWGRPERSKPQDSHQPGSTKLLNANQKAPTRNQRCVSSKCCLELAFGKLPILLDCTARSDLSANHPKWVGFSSKIFPSPHAPNAKPTDNNNRLLVRWESPPPPPRANLISIHTRASQKPPEVKVLHKDELRSIFHFNCFWLGAGPLKREMWKCVTNPDILDKQLVCQAMCETVCVFVSKFSNSVLKFPHNDTVYADGEVTRLWVRR